MELKAGDFVTVIDRASPFANAKGIVFDILDQNLCKACVRVNFGPEYSWMFGKLFRHAGITSFEVVALYKENSLSAEARAYRLFGALSRCYLYTYKRDYPFKENNFCEVRWCVNRAITRGMINDLGRIIEVDLCSEHRDMYDGKRIEFFPWKHRDLV